MTPEDGEVDIESQLAVFYFGEAGLVRNPPSVRRVFQRCRGYMLATDVFLSTCVFPNDRYDSHHH